jgi:vitamin B12 transporter
MCAVAAALSAAPRAFGQEPEPPPTPKPVFYDTATVFTRPLSSATGSVSVIDATEIESSGARSLGELLRFETGIRLLSSGGPGGITSAGIRGSESKFTLVLLDGVPLNDATDRQGGVVNLEELLTGFVERVEVVRGPLVSFYGASGLAGVVNVVTGVGTTAGGDEKTRIKAAAETGSASLLRGSASVAGAAGPGHYYAGASGEHERAAVGRERLDLLNLYAGSSVELGHRADLRLTARFGDGRSADYPEASGGPVFGSGALRRTDEHQLVLGTEVDLGGVQAPTHRLALAFSHRDQDRTSPAVLPQVPSSQEATDFSRLRGAWQTALHRSARTQVALGLAAEEQWASNASLLLLPSVLGGNVSGDYRMSRSSLAASAELLHERGRVLYELGTRLQIASGDSAQLEPRIGVRYRSASGATRLRASAGRASQQPSFFALASPRALGGNPRLKPQRTVGGELGVERSLRAMRLEVGATLFRQDFRDLVDFDFHAFLHVNRARVRAQGAELWLRWEPQRTVKLALDATWVDARDPSGTQPLLHRPRWSGGARLDWRPTARVGLRLDVRAVTRSLDHQIPVPDRSSVAGYGLSGFSAWCRWRKGWTLRTRLDNLADRRYETLIGFPGPGRSFWTGLAWGHP